MRSTAGSTVPTGTAARPEHEGRVRRFSTAERMVHRATGHLMLLCLVSAACLYLGPLAQLVGRRHLLVTVHEWSGISLPLPFLLGLLSPAFRADLRRLNRFAVYDRRWLRAVRRRRTSPEARPAGKFNAGQKLNAAITAAFAILFAVTGTLLWLGERDTRFRFAQTILIHDWLTQVSLVLFVGHLYLAVIHPSTRHALNGMTRGWVDADWAERHHEKWSREVPPDTP